MILNLFINAIEAMSDRPRELLVSSEKVPGDIGKTRSSSFAEASEDEAKDQHVFGNAGELEDERQTPNADLSDIALAKSERRTPNESILVSVADSGSGLNLDNLERLFDAFYTTKPQGLGMGLSISRSIVKAHGGRLWAMTNVPKGALFQFTLPIGIK